MLQFGFAVLISLLTAITIEIKTEIFAGLFIGFLYVQILLSSVWIALAPLKLATRVFSSTAVTLYFSLCMYRVAWRDGGGHDIAIAVALPMLLQWLLFQMPLWSIRFKGWKLKIPGQRVRDDRKEEFQFGIRHLLIWTTIVALFLAIVNAIVSSIKSGPVNSGSRDLEMGLLLTLGNGLIAVPIIWGCLVKHYIWVWILIAILVCVVFTLFELWIYKGLPDMEFFVAVNFSQTFLAILAMLAVRLTGYRLQKAG